MRHNKCASVSPEVRRSCNPKRAPEAQPDISRWWSEARAEPPGQSPIISALCAPAGATEPWCAARENLSVAPPGLLSLILYSFSRWFRSFLAAPPANFGLRLRSAFVMAGTAAAAILPVQAADQASPPSQKKI